MKPNVIGITWQRGAFAGILAILLAVAALAVGQTQTAQAQILPQPSCVDIVSDGGTAPKAAGEVCIELAGSDVEVTYSLANGYEMTQSQLALTPDEPGTGDWIAQKWQNPAGNVASGQFPYKTDHDPAVDSFTYTIPLADIGAAPGDELHIAARAEVQRSNHMTAILESGILVIGENEFPMSGCPNGVPAEPEDPGDPPGECVYLQGTTVGTTQSAPPDGISFPQLIDEVEVPLFGTNPLIVTFSSPTGLSGTFDPATGEVTADMTLEIFVQIGTLTDPTCRVPNVTLETTTGTSGAGFPTELTGTPYSDNRATLVDGRFPAPGATGCGSLLFGLVNLNNAINDELGLPQAVGNNWLAFDFLFVCGIIDPGPGTVIKQGIPHDLPCDESAGAWAGGAEGELFRPNNWATSFSFEVPAPGSISGTVTSLATGDPISGATVAIQGQGVSTTTNADGEYSFPVVMPGTYNVQASASGFTSSTQSVTVGPSEDVTQDFALAAAPGGLAGRVTFGGGAIPRFEVVPVQLWQDGELKYEVLAASSSLLAGSRGQYNFGVTIAPGDYVQMIDHTRCAGLTWNVTIVSGVNLTGVNRNCP